MHGSSRRMVANSGSGSMDRSRSIVSQAQAEAATAGYGIAYVPENLVERQIADGELIQVFDDWCPMFTGYYLYYPSRRQNSAAFLLIMNALRFRAG